VEGSKEMGTGYVLFGVGKMGGDEFMIPKENPDSDEGEGGIDSGT